MASKNVKVSFCPSCKSRNVKYIFELKNLFGIIPQMRCIDCKTQMMNFPIMSIDKKEIDKKNKEFEKKAKLRRDLK